MPTASPPKLMTTEELLALPDDGVERWLINGQLRERRDPEMTKRNRFHSHCMTEIATVLNNWVKTRPRPRGAVYCGEIGVRLGSNPDITVGVDVAYAPAELVNAQPDDSTLLVGVPTVVVEILSPSNTQEDIEEKLDAYLSAGVPVVWVANPRRRTVTVLSPGAEPALFNATHELTAEPHLPGFRVRVADLFG